MGNQCSFGHKTLVPLSPDRSERDIGCSNCRGDAIPRLRINSDFASLRNHISAVYRLYTAALISERSDARVTLQHHEEHTNAVILHPRRGHGFQLSIPRRSRQWGARSIRHPAGTWTPERRGRVARRGCTLILSRRRFRQSREARPQCSSSGVDIDYSP